MIFSPLALMYVLTGSACGGATRYLLYLLAFRLSITLYFATVIANFLGATLAVSVYCFLAKGFFSDVSNFVKHFILIGFFGSFTTFSTLCLDLGMMMSLKTIPSFDVFVYLASTAVAVFSAIYIVYLLQ